MSDIELQLIRAKLTDDQREMVQVLAKQPLVISEDALEKVFTREAGRAKIDEAWNVLEELIFLGLVAAKTSVLHTPKGRTETNLFKLTEAGWLLSAGG